METQEIKNIKSVMDHTNLKRKSIFLEQLKDCKIK